MRDYNFVLLVVMMCRVYCSVLKHCADDCKSSPYPDDTLARHVNGQALQVTEKKTLTCIRLVFTDAHAQRCLLLATLTIQRNPTPQGVPQSTAEPGGDQIGRADGARECGCVVYVLQESVLNV